MKKICEWCDKEVSDISANDIFSEHTKSMILLTGFAILLAFITKLSTAYMIYGVTVVFIPMMVGIDLGYWAYKRNLEMVKE